MCQSQDRGVTGLSQAHYIIEEEILVSMIPERVTFNHPWGIAIWSWLKYSISRKTCSKVSDLLFIDFIDFFRSNQIWGVISLSTKLDCLVQDKNWNMSNWDHFPPISSIFFFEIFWFLEETTQDFFPGIGANIKT